MIIQNNSNSLDRQSNVKLNHLFYMDDIKLYASSQEDLHQLPDITEKFTKDICMEFGIDKCKINSVKARQIHLHYYQLENGEKITPLDANESYKYLGFNQSRQMNFKETKQVLLHNFRHRLNTILKSNLNAKNVIKAINTYAIPILTYSFGIIK